MNNSDELAKFRETIKNLDPACFDGHTCFKELTPEQKLDWLAELVVFVHESRSFRVERKTP